MNVRALIIDDSKAMRAVLKHILEDMGFEAFEAGDGKEACDKLKEVGKVDLCLVDWNMPVMDGLTFVKTVRANSSYQGVKLMMVTTEREMEKVDQALSAGANNYIMKPFSPRAVRDAVEVMGFKIS
jgi:two-component system, chemotaxis family, chemotaxis protein CheY